MTWFSWPLSLVEESVMQYRYIDSVDLYRWLENQLCNTAIYINFMLTAFQLLQQFNMNSSLILIVSWWQKSQIMQFRYIDFMLKQLFNPWRDSVSPYRCWMVESIMHYRTL